MPFTTSSASSEMKPTPFGHGQSTRNEPIISPSSEARTSCSCLANSQLSTEENAPRPMVAPTPNTANSGIEPPRTAAYMPSMSRMNDPEMPGRIMAQIAIAPDTKKKGRAGSDTAPAW